MSATASRRPKSPLLGPSDLFSYQRVAIDHVLANQNAMLWVDMGLGKTVVALTAISDLIDRGEIGGALVVAPKRIVQMVWRQEAQKWSHLNWLRFSLIQGDQDARLAALRKRADIYLVNPENLVWLATQIRHQWLSRGKYPPFQMLVVDEITRMKNASSKRMQAWCGSGINRACGKTPAVNAFFSRRIGLTGEPAANGYSDLFGQYLVVDGGKRLGTSSEAFKSAFLQQSGYQAGKWICTKTGKEQVHKRIHDITLEQSAVEHLDMPPMRSEIVWVDLPPTVRKKYDDLERDLFVRLDSGADLEVQNEGSLLNKLAQVASGAAYLTVGGPWEEIHKEKLLALESVLEEAGGRPVLLGYTYVHEAARIAATIPDARFLSSSLSETKIQKTVEEWEADRIPLLCGHPASMGHGLNLQGSSSRAVVWFSLPWSLELYNQMNGRMFGGHRRQGSSAIYHILAKDTVDEAIWAAIQQKRTDQDGLKQAVSSYRERRHLS